MMLRLHQYNYLLFALSVLLMLSACSFRGDAEGKNAEQEYEFVAVGYAAMAVQQGESDDIKMLNAIKASKLEAYKELAEQVYGVMLRSENSVLKYQLQGDALTSNVSGLVRGARVLRTYHKGDLYITELGLNTDMLPNLKDEVRIDRGRVIRVKPQVYY